MASPEPGSRARHAAWHRLLDDLEASLGAAAAGGAPVAWSPPASLGPIPADLLTRAMALHAGQGELIAELEDSKRTTLAHLAALRTIPAVRARAASVYLDVTG